MCVPTAVTAGPESDTPSGTTPTIPRTGPVLVTGAAGFIGSHVAETLLRRGEHVVVVDEVNDYYDTRIKRSNLKRLTDGWPDTVAIYEGDISDGDFIGRVFLYGNSSLYIYAFE